MLEKKRVYKINGKPSVIMLTPSFPRFRGDVYSPFVLECAKNIASQGIKVLVVSSGDKDAVNYNIHPNLKVERFSYFMPKFLQKLTYSPGGIPEQIKKSTLAKIQFPFFMLSLLLRTLSRAKRYDIIHSHWVMPGIAGVIVKKIFKKPLVVTVRENNTAIVANNFLLRYVLKKADIIIVNNEQYERDILRIGVEKEKMRRILNGVNDIFKPGNKADARTKLKVPNNKKIIIFVGSLIQRKGPKDVMESFFRLKKKHKDLMLVYIGEGALKEELENEANKPPCKPDILFLGKKEPTEIKNWLNASDIFCLPTKKDGIPNAMVEAMACEVPVVMSNIGGIPDVIENWKSGIMVKPGNIDGFCSALDALIRDKKKRERMGKEGRKALLKNGVDWGINASKHINIYNELMEKFK